MRIAILLVALAMLAAPARADDDALVRKASPHSVAETIDRLAKIVESKGATVFARVDHAAGAAKAGMELRPTQALIFGNPKSGTPAMQAAQETGLDLPLRALAYEDADGKVWLVYRRPADMGASFGLPADAPALQPMAKALNALTDAAVKP